MTENKRDKRLYLFWAVYASFLPLAVIVVCGALLLKATGARHDEGWQLVLFIAAWALSYLIACLIVKVPYGAYMEKFMWEYSGGRLRNKRGSIVVERSEIVRIHDGVAPRERSPLLAFIFKLRPDMRALNDIAQATRMAMVLTGGRVIFFNFEFLDGGAAVKEAILADNRDKASPEPFSDGAWARRKARLYEVLSYESGKRLRSGGGEKLRQAPRP